MKKRFKKIYIEITNKCNLNCSFCHNNDRKKEELTDTQMEHILKQIDKYTDYIYLHVKGEPLLHQNLDKILNLCYKYNKKVNITTNGTLLNSQINNIKKYPNIRQINISMHSENNKENYLKDIIKSVKELKEDVYINYRFWVKNNLNLINELKKSYNNNQEKDNKHLKKNTYISFDKQFIWPDINNSYYNEKGTCHGLKDHIAILVNGDVTICCLDTNGETKIGNIFEEDLETILNKNKVLEIIKGFNDRKVSLELCKHCSYKERFNK